MNDPITQAIRTAVVLTNELATLGRGGSRSGTRDDIEIAIGQAQSLVPAIWQHLDDARARLAARGTDVSAYDEERKWQPAAMLAVTDVRSTSAGPHLTAALIGTNEIKSATFDSGACERARRAYTALMKAMPEVDWAQLDREDAALAVQARSLGPSAAARGIVIAVAALALAAAAYVMHRL